LQNTVDNITDDLRDTPLAAAAAITAMIMGGDIGQGFDDFSAIRLFNLEDLNFQIEKIMFFEKTPNR
jgi:hypothetical protein